MMIFYFLSSLFHFFYFIFSAAISFMFSNFSISSFFDVLLKPLLGIGEKTFLYININSMYNIYVLESLWIFP